MPSTAQLRPGQAGPQERAGKRLLQEMFLCPHVRSVKKCSESNLESRTFKRCYPDLYMRDIQIRDACIICLWFIEENIFESLTGYLCWLPTLHRNYQPVIGYCLPPFSPSGEASNRTSCDSSRRDSEASENLIAMATSCHIERTKHDALSPPCSKIRWTITRCIVTKTFDNVEVVFSCCEDSCVRLNSLGPNKAQSLRIHVPSTSNRRSKTERGWLIWAEGVTVFRKCVCGFLLLVACLHSWLMLIPMLI